MKKKQKVVIEIAIIAILIVATIGAASFTGYFIYSQLKPVNATSPGLNGFIGLKFITTEVRLPVNTTLGEK